MGHVREILRYTALLLPVLFNSCSKSSYPTRATEPIFYPAPPDSVRIQFLRRYGTSADIMGNQSKLKTFIVGKEIERPIIKPYGIDINKGILYICDSGIEGLEILDLHNKTFEYFSPTGRGKLKLPINCCIDSTGYLYVTDVERKQLVIFDENLEYSGEIGDDDNFKPTDVCINGDKIILTDPNNNRINVYDKSSLQYLYSFPANAEVGDEQWLYNPINLYSKGDYIYVTDFGNSKIKKFTSSGNYVNSIGSYGRGLGQFVRPKGIAVDNDLNIFVVDAGFDNVQIFNNEGQLLMFFGGPYKGPGDMSLPANVAIDYKNIRYYEEYVDPAYELKYLIFVTNQYGPDKVSVYGRIVPKQK